MNIQSNSSTIGGFAPGAGTVIAFNGGDGVVVDTGSANAIKRNSIFSNGGSGIDLVNGGNVSQAAPVLTSAVTVNGDPDHLWDAEQHCQHDLHGGTLQQSQWNECGPNIRGVDHGHHGQYGAGHFLTNVRHGPSPGQVITATATDPLGETSEFSSDAIVN